MFKEQPNSVLVSGFAAECGVVQRELVFYIGYV